MSHSEITNADIYELLTRLGFSLEVRVPERSVNVKPPRETLVYRHEKEGTVLKFPSKETKPALRGEILSLRTHLIGKGHLTEEAFVSFLDRGVVPT